MLNVNLIRGLLLLLTLHLSLLQRQVSVLRLILLDAVQRFVFDLIIFRYLILPLKMGVDLLWLLLMLLRVRGSCLLVEFLLGELDHLQHFLSVCD